MLEDGHFHVVFVLFPWIVKDLKLEPRQKKEETGESQTEGMTEVNAVMGREERLSPKLGDTGMLGMVEVKVWEGDEDACARPGVRIQHRLPVKAYCTGSPHGIPGQA